MPEAPSRTAGPAGQRQVLEPHEITDPPGSGHRNDLRLPQLPHATDRAVLFPEGDDLICRPRPHPRKAKQLCSGRRIQVQALRIAG